MRFADACRLLISTRITYSQIQDAHNFLVQFVQDTARLYEDSAVTPNMHLHLHLRDELQNFGCIQAFWVFSFERYNGYLKDAETNQKDCFEVTFMKRFIEKTGAVDYVRGYAGGFGRHLNEFNMLLQLAGQHYRHTEQREGANTFDYQTFLDLSLDPREDVNTNGSEPLPPATVTSMTGGVSTYLTDAHYRLLLAYYMETYNFAVVPENDPQGQAFALQRVQKFRTIEILGKTYRSTAASSPRGVNIQVLFWQDGELHAFTGWVQYFFTSDIVTNRIPTTHYLAFVRWHRTVPNSQQHFTVGGLEEWRRAFADEAPHCILPVHRIHSQVAIVPHGPQTVAETAKIVVIPLIKRTTA